jgi:hypothetical protein
MFGILVDSIIFLALSEILNAPCDAIFSQQEAKVNCS